LGLVRKLKVNKKEVIFYSGFSMEPPEQVELLENNKGKVLASSFDGFIVDVPDYKILSFWDRIEEMGVWKWRKKYPYSKLKYEQLLDGYNWELKLRDRKGRAKYCSGYQSFPRKFNDLIKELNILFGSKINF
tara:strand:- start:602 stop:997 length:396 start_codon:yes stop_codon:yes gene_type:complete